MADKDEWSDKDFFQYADIESFRAKLEDLKNYDFTGLDKKQIGDVIFSYLTVIPSLVANYVPEKFNRFLFYRVRMNVDLQKEDLRLLSTYSYPTPQYCANNGRANLKHTSVFYATNSALTAVIESKPKVGEVGYLSTWKGNADRDMKAGVLLPRTLSQENAWYVLAKDIYSFADQHYDRLRMNKNNFFHEALDFIADRFVQEASPYPITSWIANSLLYGEAWKDFIIYPSVANQAFTTNIAIHPYVANRYLQFVKVIRFKVIDMQGENFTLSTGRVGELKNNNIEWRTASPDELDFSPLPEWTE